VGTIVVDGITRELNLSKDLLDVRDLPRIARVAEIPVRASVRAGMPAVEDQGSRGKCTGMGWGAMVAFALIKQGVLLAPSGDFIYYCELDAAGDLPNDVGSTVRNGGMVLVKVGVSSLKFYSFDVDGFPTKPSLSAYGQAALFQAVKIERIPDLVGVRQHLAEGWPVVFGTDLYRSFESIQADGIMPMPTEGELANGPIGAHCMVCVGYENETQDHPITLRNSWGAGFGDAGYVHVPTAFMEKNASDYWTLELMENGVATQCAPSWLSRLLPWHWL